MSLLGSLRREMTEIIDWVDEPGVLATRYVSPRRHLMAGSTLIVRDGQAAILYEDGRLLETFPPGRHRLETSNVPFITTLMEWPRSTRSPFRSEVFFVVTRDRRSLTWGTAQPIMVQDEAGQNKNIRAFGRYGFRIADPATLLRACGTPPRLTLDIVESKLRVALALAAASVLGASTYSATGSKDVRHVMQAAVQPSFDELGLICTDVTIENIDRR